jgi:peptidase E
MCGLSAGSLCRFESGVCDSFAAELRPIRALGFLAGSHCPHYDGEANRRPAYHEMIRKGELPSGYAADDGATLHFVGRKLVRVVSSRPNARAYRVSLARGASRVVTEQPLDTHYLGEG